MLMGFVVQGETAWIYLI